MNKLAPIAVAIAALALPTGAAAKPKHSDHQAAITTITKSWAKKYKVGSPKRDFDKDGLSNLTEFLAHTNPRKADSNGNGTPDGQEDWDRDGVDNLTEQEAHTNPADADSDGDGVKDGKEDTDRDGLNNALESATANDPSDKDTDGDGVKDGNQAGTITSVTDDGLVTIKTGRGKTISSYFTGDSQDACGTSADYADDDVDLNPAPSASDDSTDDPSDDDTSDGSGDDMTDVVFEAADDTAGDVIDDVSDDSTDDTSDDSGDELDDPCGTLVKAGTYVHAASTDTDDDGDSYFSELWLVDQG